MTVTLKLYNTEGTDTDKMEKRGVKTLTGASEVGKPVAPLGSIIMKV